MQQMDTPVRVMQTKLYVNYLIQPKLMRNYDLWREILAEPLA